MSKCSTTKMGVLKFLVLLLLQGSLLFPALANKTEYSPSHVIFQDTIPKAKRSTTVTVTGTVKDVLGVAINGVSVYPTGQTSGVFTDDEGYFSIETNLNASLNFSHVNYIDQLLPVRSGAIVWDIVMEAKEGSLDEVIVSAFGQKQKKISQVGAQSTVKVAELKQPVANVGTMLAGRIAGVVQVQRSGEPGRDGADIWIRGIAVWPGQGAAPLVLVDGVERSLNNLDPQDIEEFSILKDASATAVYGVRGANGVVLIKTKTGKVGKTKIDVNYMQGITTLTRMPELADGPTYMELANEARTTRGQALLYSQEQIDKTISGEDPLLFPNVNWFEEVFNKNARNRRLNLSASGGSSDAKYYVSMAYYDEEGFLKTDGIEQYNATTRFSRYNFTSNVDFKVSKTTRLELGIQGYISNANYPGVDASAAFDQAMLITPVDFPVMYPGGLVPGRNPNGGQRNPYADITQRGYRNQFRNQVYSNVRVSQDLAFVTPGLSFTSMFSFDAWNAHDINRTKRKSTYYPDVNNPRNPDGTLNLIQTYTSNAVTLGYNRGTQGNRRFYTESALNYSRSFGIHDVSGLLLFNQTDFTNSSPNPDNFENSIPFRNRGIAARGTYAYNSRYFMELNFGYNGSENFAPNKRYGFFPSFGVGWLVSEEKFFEPLLNVVSFLKFRYTRGLVGSSSGGRRFSYITLVSDGQAGYTYGRSNNRTGLGGIQISDYGVDVGWSTSRKADLGIELKTLNNRVSIIVDFFNEYRTDIFLQRGSVPDFVGLYNNPWGNLGIIENKGIDASLEVFDINLGNVKLAARGNITYNQDRVLENDQPEQRHPWLERRGNNILAYWGYIADGLFESQEDIDNHAQQNWGPVLPGDIKYRDLNDDGIIDANDQVKIGRGDVPALTYGMGINLTWNNFYMGLFFQGTSLADRTIGGTGVIPFTGDGGIGNMYTVAVDRWTEGKENINPTYPRLGYGSAYTLNNSQTSTWWVRDMSFIRLKTAELGYTLPRNMFKSLGVSNARLYLMGVNLLTFSQFKLWDPELNTGNGTRYPPVKNISVGINVSF